MENQGGWGIVIELVIAVAKALGPKLIDEAFQWLHRRAKQAKKR